MGIMVIAMIFRAEPRKRLSQPLRTTWLKAKEGVHWIDSLIWIMLYSACWQRSSVVEQRTHKPLVAGSNPAAATYFLYWSLPPNMRDPHRYVSHILLILLAKAYQEQPLFIARDVMQKKYGYNPY